MLNKQVKVRIQEDIILSWEANCTVHGKWSKDNITLKDNDRISIENSREEKLFKLTIKEARQEDEGEYTLDLWNRHGKASGSTTVKILGMFRILSL